MNYNIVLITDNNYVAPTLVTIASLNINKSEGVCYNIHILTNNLTDENIALLKTCETNTVNINIINKSDIVSEFNTVNEKRHVSTTAILKFFIPEIFNDLDKILYLDGDILIQKDLSKLFEIDLEESYAAVVKDTLSLIDPSHMSKYKIYNDFYFNSGVMLLNLNKMRKDSIKDKLVEYKRTTETYFMDQDALNAVIGGNVKYISYKYNFLNYYADVLTIKELRRFFNEEFRNNITDVYSDCTILHLGGKEKPWRYKMGYLSDLYKSYYNQTVLKNVPLNIKQMPPKINLTVIEKIFSIKNSPDMRHKILTILGIQFSFKRKLQWK